MRTGSPRAGEIETSGFEYADILETFCVALEILKCAGAPGNFVVAEVDAGRRLAPGEDDALGVRIRERLEEHGVDDAEDGGACADAKGEGEYGDDRESRRFARAFVRPYFKSWRSVCIFVFSERIAPIS